MRAIILSVFFYPLSCCCQTTIQGKVIDLETKLPLAYSSVSVKGTHHGCITNEEGKFKIGIDALTDTLLFSYVGYGTKIISAAALQQTGEVFLERNNMQLKEVVIHADDDYLYEIMEQCRKKIYTSASRSSKVYFQLETTIQNQPVEILEAYYNGTTKGGKIEKLQLKNGRIGQAEFERSFFASLNTSQAIIRLSMVQSNEYLPVVPFQLRKNTLKKMYALKIISEFSDDSTLHLGFIPRKNNGDHFEGEVWIDKNTFSLHKINLTCPEAYVHPFLALKKGDSLSHVSLNITETFSGREKESCLSSIRFSYNLEYKDSGYDGIKHPSTEWKNVSTTGLMYFFDYDKPFNIPYFNYAAEESDYRKILSFPFNESFWNRNDGLVLSERQSHVLEFFEENGRLINYGRKIRTTENKKFDFEFTYYIPWSDTTRLQLNKNNLNSMLQKNSGTVNSLQTKSEQYNLVAQVFFDVNPEGDSIRHYSATVFDAVKSYYHLPEEPVTNCFLNLWFDICEIERRDMEKVLSANTFTLAQIDSVYTATINGMALKINTYLKQVQSGKNSDALISWNNYVRESTGIDNIKLFGLSSR